MKISQILKKNRESVEKEIGEKLWELVEKRDDELKDFIGVWECRALASEVFEIVSSSQTQLIEKLIEEAEGMKAFTDYQNTLEGNQMKHENRLYNSALQKVIDYLKEEIKI